MKRSSRGSIPRAWDFIAASDPGLLRLLLATRGVLSVTLASVLVIALTHLLREPPTVFAAGVVLSMVGPFLMRDPTALGRRTTLLLLLPPAFAAVAICGLLHGKDPAGEVFFLALLFAGTLLQARDPRAVGLGLVAVVISYVSLYLSLPIETLPLQCVGLLLGAAATAIACFVVLPLRPASTLRRAIRAVQRRTARVLREAASPSGDAHRHLMRLNEAALAAEDQLEVINQESRIALRLHLFELEQAVVRLLALLDSKPAEPRMLAKLGVAETRLRNGRPRAIASTGQDALHDALAELTRAASRIAEATDRVVADSVWKPRPVRVVRGPYAWRMAAQVTLAAMLAMAGGMALSPQRWFWAVVSVYIVFINARSRGETIHRGLHRMAGTIGGLFVGLGAAYLSGGAIWAQCAVMLIAVFSIYYFYAVSYGIAIFAVTILLGLIYGMIGAPLDEVLTLRVEETAIGVAAAMLAAGFILPIPTRHQVSLSGQAVLRAMQDVVRLSRLALTGAGDLPPIEAVRRLDRQIVDLRRSLAPLTAGRTMLRRGRAARSVTAVLACADCARALAAASRLPQDTDINALIEQANLIEARIAAMLKAEPSPPAEALMTGGGPAATAMRNLDQALIALSDRLNAGVLDAYAVD